MKIPSAKSSQKATIQKGLLDHDDPNIVQRLNTDIMAKEEAYNNYDSEQSGDDSDPQGIL